jgi:hypothetical protein
VDDEHFRDFRVKLMSATNFLKCNWISLKVASLYPWFVFFNVGQIQ